MLNDGVLRLGPGAMGYLRLHLSTAPEICHGAAAQDSLNNVKISINMAAGNTRP